MFPRRLASAPRFFVLLLVVHITPLILLTSYFTVLGLVARVLFRLAPVAQHLPAGAVREARDALVEAICFGTPANEQGPEAQEFAVRGSGVPLVGAVLADAGQDFLAFDEVLVVADVAVNVTMIFIQNLFNRQLALAPIR